MEIGFRDKEIPVGGRIYVCNPINFFLVLSQYIGIITTKFKCDNWKNVPVPRTMHQTTKKWHFLAIGQKYDTF